MILCIFKYGPEPIRVKRARVRVSYVFNSSVIIHLKISFHYHRYHHKIFTLPESRHEENLARGVTG